MLGFLKQDGSCQFIAETTMDEAAHALAGAPQRVSIALNVSTDAIEWDVVQVCCRRLCCFIPQSTYALHHLLVYERAPLFHSTIHIRITPSIGLRTGTVVFSRVGQYIYYAVAVD